MGLLSLPHVRGWKQRARWLATEVYALSLAYKDPRVPWYAKAVAMVVVWYAFSPIDLIPDFIPVLGYVDDLVVIPLGIFLALRLIPKEVLSECRAKAQASADRGRPRARLAAGIIVTMWLLSAAGALFLIVRVITS